MNKNDLHLYKNKIDIKGFSVPLKIDVGCGEYPINPKEFVGIDLHNFGQNIVWDITKGIPLPDNWVKEIYTSHCLEHFERDELLLIIWEFRRIAINGCKLTILVPHGDTEEGHYLGHYTNINEQTIKGWVKGQEGLLTLKELFRCSHNLKPFETKDINGMHLYCELIINK